MKKIVFFLLLFAQTTLAWAATADFRFRHFTVEDGLTSNSVRALVQDKEGFIWIGTDEGLNRYDGTQVKRIRLKDQGISCLFATDSLVWIGTDNGVYCYDYETEKAAFFTLATPSGIAIQSNTNHITQDKDGNLWFATVGQGVFRYQPRSGHLEQYACEEWGGLAASVLIDSENQVWAMSAWAIPGLSRLNKAENRFETFHPSYSDKGLTLTTNALAMIEDAEHNLWLGTWESGLHRIDRRTGEVTVFFHPAQERGAMHIHQLLEYAPHQLLVGSDDGLLWLNTLTGEHQLFTEDETNANSLTNRFVYPIVKDHEGGIWIGTYYGGVNYLPPYTGQFESYTHSSYANSVNGTIISGFCEDKQGRIWIGSDDGGLSCFTPATRSFTHYLPSASRNSISYHNIHALCADGDRLWIGTYTGGVNVLDLRTGQFKVYSNWIDDPHSLDGSSSYAIFRDREARIWVATMTGINLYNRETDNFTRIRDLGLLTIDIDQDPEGHLWLSTQGGGLYRFHPEKQAWKHYAHSDSDSLSLPSDQVNCTLIDRHGDIWAGTMNGLCQYDADRDTFRPVFLPIPSQNICCIIEGQNTLWLTTAKGLVRYDPQSGACQVFTQSDGLQSEQFLPNSGMMASDGKIYIGSSNGFNAFRPYQLQTNTVVPRVAITSLEIYNRPIPTGHELLPRALHHTDRLELSYRHNVFSLSFASLSYATSEKNQYAYRLDGFDRDWNYVGTEHKATYTNLPAGHYTFRVRATNNDGIWSEEEAQLRITIHPPFYWSTPAKIIYILLALASLFLFVRYLIRRTEKRHAAEIERLQVEKEKEMHEAKIKFFTMIAHEIRTPVSLIIGPLEQVMKTSSDIPAALRNELGIIDRNSQRLLYLVNQLLDFRKVEQEGMKMRFASHNISQIVLGVCDRFRPFLTQRGATLTVDCPDRAFTATVDSEALTKVVSNLLTNASKYTQSEVSVTVTHHPEQHTFDLRVADNGPGISREDQEKIFKPFFQGENYKPGTGIGLTIVKSIVDGHNGAIEVESALGAGTAFVVTLPTVQAEAVPVEESLVGLGQEVLPEDIIQESLPAAPSPHNLPTMLLVDDNREMLDFLTSTFSGKYHILTAEDGVQALERLKECEVTLIVSDWMMPRMNGVELCKAVRTDAATSHIPFILLTARTDTGSKIEGMDCGADAYVEKPFSVQYLEACIKNLVDLRNLLRQKFSRMPLVPLHSIASNPADNEFLTRMNAVIEDNFSNPELSVDFLARELCISRSGLFAKIKTLAGITPNELIQMVRLKKAAALLAEGKYRVSEICYMVGFNNPSYFAKCFQKQFGVRPGEVVKTH